LALAGIRSGTVSNKEHSDWIGSPKYRGPVWGGVFLFLVLLALHPWWHYSIVWSDETALAA